MTVTFRHPYTFSNESNFTNHQSDSIDPLWLSRHEDHFLGANGTKISWISLTAPHHDNAIIVVNGRAESYWKYQELFYDLSQQGYDIYALDHRGQGVSERLVLDSELGHIDHFDHYVDDLNTFIENIVLPHKYQHHFMLAHSMGGAIATLYLSEHPEVIDRAVLSAPMHGIHLNPWMKPWAFPLAIVTDYVLPTPTYAPGQMPYINKPFQDNKLTHSPIRYQWFRRLYEEKPELKLGGPSSRWVWQAINASERCLKQAANITVPILLLQGSSDSIVDNHAHTLFVEDMRKHGHQCEFKIIQHAKHELLFEQDNYRTEALKAIFDFFDNAPKTVSAS